MVLLNRLEKFAADRGYFSELQFGFHEGVGCIEASFTILETINHMLERGSKVFSCFLDVRKAFNTVWIDGLSSIDFSIYLHAIFHSVFTFTVQSPQNLWSNPYNRKSENGS